MAQKKNYDKAAVSKYNHEYYEKHKKLKGRKRKLKLPKSTSIRSKFKAGKSKSRSTKREIVRDFRRQTEGIRNSWNALNDDEKRAQKEEYLSKLADVKNGLKKILKKKEPKIVRNLFGPTSNRKLTFGTKSYINPAEMPISELRTNNDFSSVENLINEVLNKTKSNSKNKKKNSKIVNASVKTTKKAVNTLTKIIKKSKKKG